MQFADHVVVVTGGASGIGLGLCQRFAQEGARVVLSDRDAAAAEAQAVRLGGTVTAVACDVGREADVQRLVQHALDSHGQIDLFVSNAGIGRVSGIETPADVWHKTFDINLLAHVHAAKYALPSMLARGSGAFLSVASAAGLFVEFDDLPYTVTKHAVIGFAEWLALAYGPRGIDVSVLAPAGVVTPMIMDLPDILSRAIPVAELVDKTLAALAERRFLISTHAFVDELFKLKGTDYEAYMARMRQRAEAAANANAEQH